MGTLIRIAEIFFSPIFQIGKNNQKKCPNSPYLLCRHCGKPVRTAVGHLNVWLHVDGSYRICHSDAKFTGKFASPLPPGTLRIYDEHTLPFVKKKSIPSCFLCIIGL